MTSYVDEPYYSRQRNIFDHDFGAGFDIVYKPQVLAVVPLKIKIAKNAVQIKIQINASMVDFEILAQDKSVGSGESKTRNFTEFWTFRVDSAHNLHLVNIQQVSQAGVSSKIKSLLSIIFISIMILQPAFGDIWLDKVYVGSQPKTIQYHGSASPTSYVYPTPVRQALDANKIFNLVNLHRQNNNILQLIWSDDLCTYASNWAEVTLDQTISGTSVSAELRQSKFQAVVSSYRKGSIWSLNAYNAFSDFDPVNMWINSAENDRILLLQSENGYLFTKGCVSVKSKGNYSSTVLILGR